MRMVFPHQTGRLMDDLATDVGTLVESFFGDRPRAEGGDRYMAVPLDIDESDDAYTVTLDVPGVANESIEIDVHEDTLTIKGERQATAVAGRPAEEESSSESGEAQPAGQAPVSRARRRERPYGKFERKLRLPHAVEHDAVSAELADGVLVVSLPKADPNKGKRRVPVTHG